MLQQQVAELETLLLQTAADRPELVELREEAIRTRQKKIEKLGGGTLVSVGGSVEKEE